MIVFHKENKEKGKSSNREKKFLLGALQRRVQRAAVL